MQAQRLYTLNKEIHRTTSVESDSAFNRECQGKTVEELWFMVKFGSWIPFLWKSKVLHFWRSYWCSAFFFFLRYWYPVLSQKRTTFILGHLQNHSWNFTGDTHRGLCMCMHACSYTHNPVISSWKTLRGPAQVSPHDDILRNNTSQRR